MLLKLGLEVALLWVYILLCQGGLIMKFALIMLGLLVTTGVVYAACLFC
jgi:hypothetical protein